MESSTFPSPSRNFYSRPCGRGDFVGLQLVNVDHFISTHAPAGGATFAFSEEWDGLTKFLLTPLREGRQKIKAGQHVSNLFLLTPLREGRRRKESRSRSACRFLLTPLREGRPDEGERRCVVARDFYSRPCGRGDPSRTATGSAACDISTHAPAGGATVGFTTIVHNRKISTHAPAGGATGFRYDKRARSIISTHAPAGGATGSRAGRGRRGSISTHAPAGGATCCSCGYGCG